jgi:hypothetical protein
VPHHTQPAVLTATRVKVVLIPTRLTDHYPADPERFDPAVPIFIEWSGNRWLRLAA